MTPQDKAAAAWRNGFVPTFLKALCELLMCSDPWPASPESDRIVKGEANFLAVTMGFDDWVEAYHGLCWVEPEDQIVLPDLPDLPEDERVFDRHES